MDVETNDVCMSCEDDQPSVFELFVADYTRALDLVRERNDACISLFQDELGYGFLKSKAILDIMRMSGVV